MRKGALGPWKQPTEHSQDQSVTDSAIMNPQCVGFQTPHDAVNNRHAADDDLAEVASSEEEIRASCTNPRRYFVFRDAAGACEPVEGRRGRWIPGRLFADAPEEVQASTCAYTWSGAKYSRPDRDALIERVAGCLDARCRGATLRPGQ